MQKSIYEEEYRQMISTLRQARKAKGLRQEDVARELGVCRTWVTKTEQCDLRLDVLQLVRLAELYGVDPLCLIHALRAPDRSSGTSATSST